MTDIDHAIGFYESLGRHLYSMQSLAAKVGKLDDQHKALKGGIKRQRSNATTSSAKSKGGRANWPTSRSNASNSMGTLRRSKPKSRTSAPS